MFVDIQYFNQFLTNEPKLYLTIISEFWKLEKILRNI